MKSTPLLFKPEMIRACLDGRKRMTRRLVKPQPPRGTRVASYAENGEPTEFVLADRHGDPIDAPPIKCRYGLPGDEIWTKETWRPELATLEGDMYRVEYAADSVQKIFHGVPMSWGFPKAAQLGRNVSPLFMPRWASRFVRKLTRVRVERLQMITEEDARAEGVLPLSSISPTQHIAGDSRTQATHPHCVAFAVLWDQINGKRAPWASNPWVWVLEW